MNVFYAIVDDYPSLELVSVRRRRGLKYGLAIALPVSAALWVVGIFAVRCLFHACRLV